MSKILIIVDAQYDFLEGGNLAVEGAISAMLYLSEYILENGLSYDKIILTADWHPATHCSFKVNGGIWPTHCVQFTYGAAIYQPIIDALDDINADYTILTKGVNEDHEEYSVFKNKKSLNEILKIRNEFSDHVTIDFVGIAYNYCVKDSAIDAKKHLNDVDIRILKEFCPCIGESNEATSLLENNGIEVITKNYE